jgi:hypothetical protein
MAGTRRRATRHWNLDHSTRSRFKSGDSNYRWMIRYDPANGQMNPLSIQPHTSMFHPPIRLVGIERHGPIGIGNITVGIHVPVGVGGSLAGGIGGVAILGGDGRSDAIIGAEAGSGAVIRIPKGIDTVADKAAGISAICGGVAGRDAIDVRVDVIVVGSGIGVRRARGS